MSDFKLRECPFCGGEGFVFKSYNCDLITFSVMCKVCHASTNQKVKERFAIEAWNRRFGEEDKHETGRC